ncbi:MAG: amidohydrolase [Chloroflexi bacterium]|nr:amidohydrolase [Chloroflexota bacterium]
MIIDMRLRPPTGGWTKTVNFDRNVKYYPSRIGFPRAPSAEQMSVDLLFEEMDAAGIAVGVIMGRQSSGWLGRVPNDDIATFAVQHPQRFVWLAGVGLLDLERGLEELERTRRLPGCKGISIEPAIEEPPLPADDPRILPLYRRCEELGLVVSITMSALAGGDTSLADPAPVHRVARRFPDLRIVLSHACWPYVHQAIGVAFCCPNVYLSPDQYMNHRYMPGASEYVNAANLFLADRLVWGSSYPSRPLIESVAAFDHWTFEPGVREKVLYHNAARLLGLE